MGLIRGETRSFDYGSHGNEASDMDPGATRCCPFFRAFVGMERGDSRVDGSWLPGTTHQRLPVVGFRKSCEIRFGVSPYYLDRMT